MTSKQCKKCVNYWKHEDGAETCSHGDILVKHSNCSLIISAVESCPVNDENIRLMRAGKIKVLGF